MLRKLRFSLAESTIPGCYDAAYLRDGEDPNVALQEALWDSVRTDLQVTIGDVTMFADAWVQPDMWLEDWADKLGVSAEHVPTTVEGLLSQATE